MKRIETRKERNDVPLNILIESRYFRTRLDRLGEESSERGMVRVAVVRDEVVMWIVNSSILNRFISIWERKYSQALFKTAR